MLGMLTEHWDSAHTEHPAADRPQGAVSLMEEVVVVAVWLSWFVVRETLGREVLSPKGDPYWWSPGISSAKFHLIVHTRAPPMASALYVPSSKVVVVGKS